MGLLQQSSKGVLEQEPVIVLYGEGGLGKSTFLAEAEDAYALDIEGGTANLNIERSPKPESFDQVVSWLDELIAEKRSFKAYGIDGIDTLEQLLFKKICKEHGNAKSIVDAAQGYGNGFKIAIEKWFELHAKLNVLRHKKKAKIIIIGHSVVSTFNDPTTDKGYDRFSIKLQESAKVSAARAWFDFADCVLFAKREVLERGNDEKKSKLRRAIDANDGENIIFTQGRAAFDAKNRYGLPFKMPLRYAAFEEAMKRGPRTVKQIKAAIDSLVSEIKDTELVSKIKENVAEVGDDSINLRVIEERIIEILAEERKG